MKNMKWMALLLAATLAAGALTACSNDTTDDGSNTESNTVADTTNTNIDGNTDVESEVISIVDAKATDGMTGDFKAAFAAESGDENVITGVEQKGISHSISAVLASPTVITSVVLTAPSENQELLASATIEGSVNGSDWVVLKSLGGTITAGKTYTMNINNETAYLYLRVRQADSMRTQAFAFRNMVINGVPQEGSAGSLSAIVGETEQGTLLGMGTYYYTSTQSGAPADVFLDNPNSWSAGASTEDQPNWLIATMAKKTEIRKVVVKLWDSNRLARGTVIQGSVDGAEWTDLYTIEDLQSGETTAESGEWTYYVNDATQYSFIRLLQKGSIAPYGWKLNTVLVYGIESNETANEMPRKYIDSTTVSVSYVGTTTVRHEEDGTADQIWDTSDKTTKYTAQQNAAAGLYYVSGSFAKATVITKIVYYSPATHANRVRGSYFEASVDGTNWVKLATLPSSEAPFANSGVVELTIDDDTAYNYIRLVQRTDFYTYYWSVGTVEVIGLATEN